MESEAQNYGREAPKKGFSLFLEEAKETEKDLAEIENDIAEGKEYLEEAEKDLRFVKEMNEFAAEEGLKGFPLEEIERAKKMIDSTKKIIVSLENSKSRADYTILRLKAIDARWEKILIENTPPTEH